MRTPGYRIVYLVAQCGMRLYVQSVVPDNDRAVGQIMGHLVG